MPLTAADVAALDRNAAALGVPTATLMANAGAAVARVVTRDHAVGPVLVLAGTGNNGGDGAVAARLLAAEGRDVRLVLCGDAARIRSRIAREAFDAARTAGVRAVALADVRLEDELKQAAVVVDAVLGVGVVGGLREPLAALVAAVNAARRPVIAVDVPTGLAAGTPIVARATVTFHDRKSGMEGSTCGEIIVADIGIPAAAEEYVGPGDLSARYPRSRSDAHKGQNGKILVVGGGGPYTGAPILSALGAFATGTDLVHMGVPEPAAVVARVLLPEAIVHPLLGDRFARVHVTVLEEVLKDATVLCIGPGLGREPDTLNAARELVELAIAAGKPVVVDADGLTAFSPPHEGDPHTLRRAPVVITPHAGEFQRLTGIEVSGDGADRERCVREWLEDGDCVILLKGKEDLIVARDRVVRNRTHHAVMTTGGTGDVLAGVTAALIGRGLDRFDAARVAAYLNGAAGQEAYKAQSYGVKATDVVRMIPAVLKEHLAHYDS